MAAPLLLSSQGEPDDEIENTPKIKYGEFQNILLSAQEYEKLVSRLGDAKTNDLIERLSAYIKSRNKKYESHYATILNWARDDAIKEKGLNREHSKNLDPDKYIKGKYGHMVRR